MATTNSTAGIGRCPGKCGRTVRDGQPCVDCRRRLAWGTLVALLGDHCWDTGTDLWAGLDAVADLMTLHAVERRAHRREVDELVKDVQAAARDGYQQAREESARDEWGY
jgi:hypothetical protein